MSNINNTQKFMRAKELAKYLGIGLSTVWLYAKQGKITPKKISDKITVFNVEDVEKALIGGAL
ncbi:helix-turn-helix domain-containing protein [Aliarcobacter butzleri]|uniref:helix-turn-helix transcriptional regulator n=2 Tax=Aliarcobacter butzleri TaxID=28197 RepID=UPI0021B445EC|nr:helix-turn-helix domain-containing protein [Aliarcobacter butzleri]MCT7566745.1 helix-turn-helix domain-containing protein [Aliarcobacter butzleri]MCT7577320.1 helix-turn-helix domain-containing protein [Aliarcobacter butzleri]